MVKKCFRWTLWPSKATISFTLPTLGIYRWVDFMKKFSLSRKKAKFMSTTLKRDKLSWYWVACTSLMELLTQNWITACMWIIWTNMKSSKFLSMVQPLILLSIAIRLGYLTTWKWLKKMIYINKDNQDLEKEEKVRYGWKWTRIRVWRWRWGRKFNIQE